MTRLFKGTIVEESLTDNRFINELRVTGVKISAAEDQADRWHLYSVELTGEQIDKLSHMLKPQKWYAHFWDDHTIVVVYPGKQFTISRHDKTTWHNAIVFGKSLGIPQEQLDFLTE